MLLFRIGAGNSDADDRELTEEEMEYWFIEPSAASATPADAEPSSAVPPPRPPPGTVAKMEDDSRALEVTSSRAL